MVFESPEREPAEKPDITFYTCFDGAQPAEEEEAPNMQPNVTFDINHYTTAICIEP